MDFNYVRFTEEWAMLYKPMRHIPGPDSLNKRFYICDSYFTMTEFLKGSVDPEVSPCVMVESQQEGNVEEGRDYPRYSFYFLVRAEDTHNGHMAYDSKSDAKKIMMDFVNFIRAFKSPYEYTTPTGTPLVSTLPFAEGSYLDSLRKDILNGFNCMMNINIENFTYESLNELYDGWYGVQMTLDDIQIYDMCLDEAMYEAAVEP